jgi:MFS family permease
VWAWWELRIEHPLVDLRLVRHRAVLTANVSGFFLGVTMYVLLVIIVQFVQLPGYGLGESVFIAGLTLVPMSIFSASVSRTLPWLVRRVGVRPIIPAGALCVSAAALFFALTTTALWQMFLTMGLVGIGLGYTFAAMPGLIVGAVPAEETGSAMGFYQVSRFVGFAFGSGLAITLLRAFGTANEPTLGSYRSVALVAAALGVLTALIAWFLPGKPAAVQTPELEAYEIEEGELAAAGLEDTGVLQPVGAR